MRRNSLFLVLLMPFFVLFGQENAARNDSTQLLENIHLHLNKTTFLQGERLWFKAYVRDQLSKLPSLETTNLHVGIYDGQGKELKRKLLYVENGMAQGDFAIDSVLTDREYTILAWTNFMRNFKELPPFRQQIQILNDGPDNEDAPEVNMTISIYPEGGQLIEGAYNTIGILVDNGLGQGVQVDNLEVVDESGNVIQSNIATNQFGMGKTGFLVEAGKSYILQREREGLSMLRQPLPPATTGQVGLGIDNNGKDKVLFKLVASKATFKAKDDEMYTMGIYQDDFLLFEEVEINEDEPVISIKREQLPFGTLTATLFDAELSPIAYRMFFNHREDADITHDLEIEHCLTEFGDSLQVDLIVPRGIEQDTKVSLSALPSYSQAYGADNSLISSFLLQPYTNTSFQDRYFFEGIDRRKRYELDKRLMIEGWGRYDWDSRKLERVKLQYEMESGVPFEGKVIDADLNEERQVSLIAELSSAMGFEELDGNKSFSTSMQLFEGDSLRLSLISKKGKLRKPNAELWFDRDNKIPELNLWMVNKLMRQQKVFNDETETGNPLNISDRIIALEEVVVTESRGRKNKFQISASVQGRLIDDSEIQKTPALSSYLMKLGFLPRGNNGEIGFYVRRPPGFARVPILINGMNAMPGEIIGMPLSSVKYLAFNKSRDQPFISIVLNPNYIPLNRRNKFLKFAVENGYARPQEYFTPNYPDYTGRVFKTYGALDWKPNISVGAELPTSITIPIKNQNKMRLYIEGMNAEGVLISETKVIPINPE